MHLHNHPAYCPRDFDLVNPSGIFRFDSGYSDGGALDHPRLGFDHMGP